MAKRLQPIAVAVAAVLAGLWLGEHSSSQLLPSREILVLLACMVAAAWPLWSASRTVSALTGLGAAVAFCVPWLTGVHEARYAFNDCVQNGEQARRALASFRSSNGRFPASLAELEVHVPGELVFPPHTLRYNQTATGYVLSFSDRLVTHEATEAHAFEAHK